MRDIMVPQVRQVKLVLGRFPQGISALVAERHKNHRRRIVLVQE
jgi:hypothetical protein